MSGDSVFRVNDSEPCISLVLPVVLAMTTAGTSPTLSATLGAASLAPRGPLLIPTTVMGVPVGLNSCPLVCVTMFAGMSLVPHSVDAASMASIEAL